MASEVVILAAATQPTVETRTTVKGRIVLSLNMLNDCSTLTCMVPGKSEFRQSGKNRALSTIYLMPILVLKLDSPAGR